MGYYLITFANTHTAIAAQKYLKERISFQIMPTLREISDSCGISLKVQNDSPETIISLLNSFEAENNLYQIYWIEEGMPPTPLTSL